MSLTPGASLHSSTKLVLPLCLQTVTPAYVCGSTRLRFLRSELGDSAPVEVSRLCFRCTTGFLSGTITAQVRIIPGTKSGSSFLDAKKASSFLESTKNTLLCFETEPGVLRRPFGVLIGVGLIFDGDFLFVGVRKQVVGTEDAEKT